MTEEEIRIDEDELAEEGNGNEWVEELKVSGDQLLETVKGLIHEAGVRRIVIQNSQKRVLLEIPLVLGLTGIALFPVYSAIALFAALVADCTVLVERVEKELEEKEPEGE